MSFNLQERGCDDNVVQDDISEDLGHLMFMRKAMADIETSICASPVSLSKPAPRPPVKADCILPDASGLAAPDCDTGEIEAASFADFCALVPPSAAVTSSSERVSGPRSSEFEAAAPVPASDGDIECKQLHVKAPAAMSAGQRQSLLKALEAAKRHFIAGR